MLLISLIYSLFFLSLLFLRINFFIQYFFFGLPRSLSGKESASNAGNMGSYPRLVRSPGGGHGNPLQYSCVGNPMDRGAWQRSPDSPWGCKKVRHNLATKQQKITSSLVFLNFRITEVYMNKNNEVFTIFTI